MKLKLLSIIVVSIFLLGCNNSSDNDNSVVHEELKETTVKENKKEMLKNDVGSHSPIALIERTNKMSASISLNGVKFKLVDKKFEQGAQVYNLSINEFGTIKGSFILVVINEENFNKNSFSKVVKIAHKTFRVWPLKEIDLRSSYRELISDSNLSTVEAEVDYTPISKRQTH